MSYKKPFRAVPIRQRKPYRRKRRIAWNRLSIYVCGAALVGLAVGAKLNASNTLSSSVSELTSARYYPNCSAARAAGVAPLNQGDPGYRSELDRDNDGIACEPFVGR
jgi:hypothetical protein